jgi:hypothetical protein
MFFEVFAINLLDPYAVNITIIAAPHSGFIIGFFSLVRDMPFLGGQRFT